MTKPESDRTSPILASSSKQVYMLLPNVESPRLHQIEADLPSMSCVTRYGNRSRRLALPFVPGDFIKRPEEAGKKECAKDVPFREIEPIRERRRVHTKPLFFFSCQAIESRTTMRRPALARRGISYPIIRKADGSPPAKQQEKAWLALRSFGNNNIAKTNWLQG